jgi:hypothetical protein
MFLENSRYFNQATMTVKLKDGSKATLVQPRLLPSPAGVATTLQANDRLDIIALRQYQDGTKFWHVADANSEIEARLLTEPPEMNSAAPPVQTIQIPEK